MNYKALLKHPFIADNFWYGLSNIFVNVLNYAYVLMALHYLSKDSFGAFNALVAVLTMTTILANPMQLHATKAISCLQRTSLRLYLARLQNLILSLSSAGLLLVVLASQHFASLLNVSAAEVIVTGVATALLVLATLATAVSSGLRKLTFQAVLGLGSSIAKFLCALVLFQLGFEITAGLAGYIAGFALTLLVTRYMLKAWELSGETGTQSGKSQDSLVVLLLAFLFVAAPFSMDQILAQALSPKISGNYAALVTIGKLAFFVSTPFLVVLYSYMAGAKDSQQQMSYLWAGLAVAVGASLLLTALLWVGGRRLTDLLLSPSYSSVADWIVPYSLGICGYVFSYGVVSLAIVRNDSRILMPISLATIVQPILFLTRHQSLADLVTNQLISLALLSLAALFYLLFCCKQRVLI